MIVKICRFTNFKVLYKLYVKISNYRGKSHYNVSRSNCAFFATYKTMFPQIFFLLFRYKIGLFDTLYLFFSNLCPALQSRIHISKCITFPFDHIAHVNTLEIYKHFILSLSWILLAITLRALHNKNRYFVFRWTVQLPTSERAIHWE